MGSHPPCGKYTRRPLGELGRSAELPQPPRYDPMAVFDRTGGTHGTPQAVVFTKKTHRSNEQVLNIIDSTSQTLDHWGRVEGVRDNTWQRMMRNSKPT